MRSIAMLTVALLSGCEEPAPPIVPDVERPAAPEPRPEPDPARPWTVRFVRACSEWSYATARADSRHIVACERAVYDRATGVLLRIAPAGHEHVGARGEWSYWSASEGVILATEGAREPIAIAGDLSPVEAAATGELIAHGSGSYHRVRGATAELIGGSEICDPAVAMRADGDVVQCLVRDDEGTTLRAVGQNTRVALPRLDDARWTGSHWIAVGDRVYWIDEAGSIVHQRDAIEPRLLDVSTDGALVSSDGRTEIWRLDGDGLAIEPVYARRSDEGAFAGDQIVLLLSSRNIVWLHRGEPRALPELPAPTPPRGFVALRPAVDDDSASWQGEAGTFNRGPNDVAAFSRERPWAHVVVSRSDALELSRFTDDAAWAAMAAARYLDDGSERWARHWRGEEGRVMRGHTYIGGCERTHIDVVVRERGEVLETWVVHSAHGRGFDSILGAMPDGSVEIREARSDDYRGDPSIGSTSD